MKIRYNNIINSKVFKDPIQNMQNNYLRLDGLIKQMENIIKTKEQEKEKDFKAMVLKLDALSPLKTMVRGFSIIEKEGKIVKQAKDLKKDDNISIKLIDGNVNAKIL